MAPTELPRPSRENLCGVAEVFYLDDEEAERRRSTALDTSCDVRTMTPSRGYDTDDYSDSEYGLGAQQLHKFHEVCRARSPSRPRDCASTTIKIRTLLPGLLDDVPGAAFVGVGEVEAEADSAGSPIAAPRADSSSGQKAASASSEPLYLAVASGGQESSSRIHMPENHLPIEAPKAASTPWLSSQGPQDPPSLIEVLDREESSERPEPPGEKKRAILGHEPSNGAESETLPLGGQSVPAPERKLPVDDHHAQRSSARKPTLPEDEVSTIPAPPKEKLAAIPELQRASPGDSPCNSTAETEPPLPGDESASASEHHFHSDGQRAQQSPARKQLLPDVNLPTLHLPGGGPRDQLRLYSPGAQISGNLLCAGRRPTTQGVEADQKPYNSRASIDGAPLDSAAFREGDLDMAEEPSGATWLGSSRGESSSVPVADEYEVVVDRSNGLPLGLWVSTGEGEVDRLRVDGVCEGLAEQWNLAHPDCQIREGDYIVEVNSTRGDAVLMEQKCLRSRVVRMRLRREASWTQRTRDTLKDAATSGLNSARALSEDVAVLGLGSAMIIADGLLSFGSAASCVVKGGLVDAVSSVFSQPGQADAPKGLQDMGQEMSSPFFAHRGSGVAHPQHRSREYGYVPQFYVGER